MSFLKKIFDKYKSPLTVFAFSVSLFSISSVVFGQIIRPPDSNSPDDGKIFGFAWMGTGIENPNVSEGGGGWLKFNCEPDFCEDGVRPWGVKLDLRSLPDRLNPARSNYGALTGNAWSSNYGWLTFDPDIVESCWQSYPMSPQFVAKVFNLDDLDPALGDFRKLAGWGKFMNGDDVADDGYDGCVSFAGLDHVVELNIITGALTGWAWGGPVVGWISFQNPECPFCDTSVVLPGSANINFWAHDVVVEEGGGTILEWEAINSPTKWVNSCTTYSNSSNYPHWRSTGGDGTNVGPIDITIGNLPNGTHAINGINQTTTYRLTCRTSDGQTLPMKIATVTVTTEIKGCMDPVATNYNPLATEPAECFYDAVLGCTIPIADNYNPLATVDDGSCVIGAEIIGCTDPVATNFNPLATISNPASCVYAPGIPILNLDVGTSSLVVGSGSYPTGTIQWSSTNNAALLPNSCNGSFSVDGVTASLSGWTGARANPNNFVSTINIPAGLLSGVVAGDVLQFTITCQSLSGVQVSDTDNIIMTVPVDPPDPPPVVDLFIVSPNNDGNNRTETLSDIGGIVNLGWTVQNATSCTSSSQMVVNGSADTNTSWNSSNFTPIASGSRTIDMTVGSSAYAYPTTFILTCVNDDGVSDAKRVRVWIDGIICPPTIIPTCTPAGSNIPGYEEF